MCSGVLASTFRRLTLYETEAGTAKSCLFSASLFSAILLSLLEVALLGIVHYHLLYSTGLSYSSSFLLHTGGFTMFSVICSLPTILRFIDLQVLINFV